jgi:hypothetical protein
MLFPNFNHLLDISNRSVYSDAAVRAYQHIVSEPYATLGSFLARGANLRSRPLLLLSPASLSIRFTTSGHVTYSEGAGEPSLSSR